jgi:long-chain acyl-CoA synthetase
MVSSIENMPEQVTIERLTFNRDLSHGPYFVDGCDTLVKLWSKRCAHYGSRTAHREKDLGIWLSYSWAEFYNHGRLIGMGLREMGLKRGDAVAILSEDNKEWIYTDLGVQAVGGIVTGVYTTDSARQLAFIINDSQSQFLIVENDEQLDKYLSIADQVTGLKKVIVLDRDGLHDFTDDKVIFLEDLYAAGQAAVQKDPAGFDAEIDRSDAADTALLVYTSGTTGDPKGVEIPHRNIMCTISTGPQTLPVWQTDEQLCFLPLCHILERLISVFQPIASGSTVNFAESSETVFDNIVEVSPTTFTAVPRVWEKMFSGVSIRMKEATPLSRWIYNRALKAGTKLVSETQNGTPRAWTRTQYRFWDFVVLRNLRRMMGMDRLRRGTTGAAPISPDLLLWFRAIGVTIYEGYGMSESSGIISLNTNNDEKIGSVGKAVPGVSIRIAEYGEVQYNGGNQFKGYWKKPGKTKEALTKDGWLRTGDVGVLDGDGFLTITGRLKDIIITAGGKNVAPAMIENRLKFSPYISDAVVIGDRRKFLSCLVMIDQENVEKFAQDNRVPFSDFASLCHAEAVLELIKNTLDEVNQDFARVEQIKDFRLIDILLTAEDDELTATMKLKRGFVEEKHKALIDEMYV